MSEWIEVLFGVKTPDLGRGVWENFARRFVRGGGEEIQYHHCQITLLFVLFAECFVVSMSTVDCLQRFICSDLLC